MHTLFTILSILGVVYSGLIVTIVGISLNYAVPILLKSHKRRVPLKPGILALITDLLRIVLLFPFVVIEAIKPK